MQRVPPLLHLRFALAQDLSHQRPESLRQRGVRDVALVLLELAGGEQGAPWDQHLVQLAYERRLADTGIAGYQHQFRCAVGHDPLKGRDQNLDLGLSPIKLLRDQQLGRSVVRAEREGVNAPLRLPLRQATAQIGLQPGGSLVPLFGRFGKQLHDDGREQGGNAAHMLDGRSRLPCEVAME